jgi:hypothetical protein
MFQGDFKECDANGTVELNPDYSESGYGIFFQMLYEHEKEAIDLTSVDIKSLEDKISLVFDVLEVANYYKVQRIHLRTQKHLMGFILPKVDVQTMHARAMLCEAEELKNACSEFIEKYKELLWSELRRCLG